MSVDVTGLMYPTGVDLDLLLARGPKMADTVRGPIEYGEAGEGPVLLSVHGSGGGWSYALGMAGVFALNGFRVIAPSRPGFLGTPLSVGRSYRQQAEALSALLDALNIGRAAVLGFSGGGPPAYLLAVGHPEHVSALVQVGAVSSELGRSWNPLMERLVFNRVGMELFAGCLRLALAVRPALGVRLLMAGETTQDSGYVAALAGRIMADPHRAGFVTRVWMCNARSVGAWLAGQGNDDAQMRALTGLDLTGVCCPTLIVGGAADPFHRFDEYAAAHVPDAQVVTIPNGGHRSLWVGDDYAQHQATVLAWLRQHAPGAEA